MPDNVSAVMDETYNYSMWVEIYNPGANAENLSNYYFSDDNTNLKKWRPSSMTVNAKGYVVLWFERDKLSAQHCTFKLDPDGGALYLSNASGEIVNSVTYPAQFRNVSYGRETDGADNWVFFEDYSPGTSNNNRKSASLACGKPVFTLSGGFYSLNQKTGFETPLAGDTIYYSMNGSEPTRSSTRYTAGEVITLFGTSILRARAFSGNKLPSDISTATYFIRERNFDLPVVSIVTEQKNLTDNTIGIYVKGTNGISGNGSDDKVNWNQPWDRPANFELFDASGKTCLNQELEITVSGGWSRMNPQKSLQIDPKKKYGNNKLSYDIFYESKPGHKYRSIQLRNSGNDFWYTMMRDGFMNTLVANRMNQDYAAYKPAVCFMNGVYYGIQNLRERSNTDYIYSNYGLAEEEISLLDPDVTYSDPAFQKLVSYVRNNDVTKADVYNRIDTMMDIDNFMNYFISEIFWNNTDWPGNNLKVWKKLDGGKWRWILYDTDFGFGLYDAGYNNNTLTYTFNSSSVPSCIILNRLLLNETFRNRFIDRFCIQISSTFETQRVNHVMDSLVNAISKEMVYHKAKWGGNNFNSEIQRMKTFSSQRPSYMLSFLGSYFFGSAAVRTIDISSNIDNASYIFNSEDIIDNTISLKSFQNRKITLEPNPTIKGYKFNHWEILSTNDTVTNPVFTATLTDNLSIKAVFDEDSASNPEEEASKIFINEIVASNGTYKDEYGNTSDYVELYNAGENEVNIAGWYFSDEKTNLTLCQIPTTDSTKTAIPAKGRIIIWFDKQPQLGVLHVSKGLSKDGETVILSRRDAWGDVGIIDSVTFPALQKDMSYSRVPDGSDNWVIQAATFNLPNSQATSIPAVEAASKVYPTVVDDYITVEQALGKQVKIYDTAGRIFITVTCRSEKETIRLTDLPQGAYIIRTGNSYSKIIKR